MKSNKSKLVVLSGGLDSTTMLYDITNMNGSDKMHAVSFDYGQKHTIELEKAALSCKKLRVKHTVVDMRFLGDMVAGVSALIRSSDINVPTIQDVLGDPAPVTEVPYRNMIMCSLALAYAQSNDCDEVYLGIQKHDQYGYWDTSVAFLESINAISELNRKHSIKIKAPYVNLSKEEEIEIGKALELPYADTWTCYKGPDDQNRACGTCPTCSERIVAFAKYGTEDPVPYAIDIPWVDLIQKYAAGD